ncbi:MAG: tRNA (N6-isopentenyl adenosine(37)-C2)-methylthiotransferase MiaB [Ignavibacteria bacterium]|nr:tRNA (N6-isopentenyl adenosine(37)-C2)-methylthiotransferase MiaB [Ignavibacteria bacterium]
MKDNLFDIIGNPKERSSINPETVNGGKIYIETYGCQMNLSDSEIVLGLLGEYGYIASVEIENSDVIFLNTCSVRENAEKKIFNRLKALAHYKKKNPNVIIGVLGCMAERLKDNLLNKSKIVDLIVGPDEYRKLPALIENVIETGEKGIAVKLSKAETYDDIIPIRKNSITAWISVMRGCNKFCTYCIVPYTRGRERSRKAKKIVNEAISLNREGIKEITLLGQNVNSYRDAENDFPDLLGMVADAVPDMRIRYVTSHPYDLSDKLLETMAVRKNICKYIHLPVQSGSDRILKLMNREYSIEKYTGIVEKARKLMPEIAFSTDIITGFPTETEDDHKMTLDLIKNIKFDGAFMFAYSPRENTKAFKMDDDVTSAIKHRRLEEIIETQKKISLEINKLNINKTMQILIETLSKKSPEFIMGRTDCNKTVIIPKSNHKIGDYVNVLIERVNSATLFAKEAI